MNIKITIEAPQLAGAIESLAAALGSFNPAAPATNVFVGGKKQLDTPKQDKTPEKKQEPTATKEEPKKEEKPEISLEVVRSKLAEFSSQGKEQQKQVMQALSHFGVKKLTEVDPKDYKELLELVGLSV